MRRRSFAFLLLSGVLAGCAPSVQQPLHDVPPVPTPTPRPIRLPQDDAPHTDLTEWWYYTGHLLTVSGLRYGFELVVFQVARAGAPFYYAAHFAITDHQRRAFHFAQATWSLDHPPSSFDLEHGGWRISGDGHTDRLAAAMPDYAIDLRLEPRKPPTLHGMRGVVSFGPVGDSYYYSETRLDVAGTISDHGIRQTVTGRAWKDRQWGNFLVLNRGGWDWFSIQLDDGRDLMLFLLRGPLGEVTPAYGTLVLPSGVPQVLEPGAAVVAATGQWTSPRTGVRYPSGWSVSLPVQGLHLELRPVIPDQELDTRSSTGQIYWEGEVVIDGSSDGRPVAGQGYVELTGYAADRT
jgi:predicted secreted hydrolase